MTGGESRKINREEIVKVFIQAVLLILPVCTTHEDGTERSETSAHKIQKPGESPKIKYMLGAPREGLNDLKNINIFYSC